MQKVCVSYASQFWKDSLRANREIWFKIAFSSSFDFCFHLSLLSLSKNQWATFCWIFPLSHNLLCFLNFWDLKVFEAPRRRGWGGGGEWFHTVNIFHYLFLLLSLKIRPNTVIYISLKFFRFGVFFRKRFNCFYSYNLFLKYLCEHIFGEWWRVWNIQSTIWLIVLFIC